MSEFDITKHEWSDDGLVVDDALERNSTVLPLSAINNESHSWSDFDLSRKDAIAIARYFKLTEGDLK